METKQRFSVNIAFTEDQLHAIFETRCNLIIAKPILSPIKTVAWQSFEPMEANTISWEETYGIYVSPVDIDHDAVLVQQANTGIGVHTLSRYVYDQNGVITEESTGGTRDAYTLLNNFNEKDYVTAGLYQQATVNNQTMEANAISATAILLKSTALMTPSPTIYIWLQAGVPENAIVTNVTAPMTRITFDHEVYEASVRYDTQTGMFIPIA